MSIQTGTLLIRLAGPMQSWGTNSRFTVRDTRMEPSKSGVVGLISAALGIPRDGDIRPIAALKMGVRVDREGVMTYDYQTAQNIMKAGGKPHSNLKETEVSTRYYLADASFLAGLEGDLSLLETIHAALRNPRWPLFLGRKAFVPGEPVWLEDGLKPGLSLKEALDPKTYPWHPRPGQNRPDRLRLVLEDDTSSDVRPDQPLSFQSNTRRFAPRRVRTDWLPLSSVAAIQESEDA